MAKQKAAKSGAEGARAAARGTGRPGKEPNADQWAAIRPALRELAAEGGRVTREALRLRAGVDGRACSWALSAWRAGDVDLEDRSDERRAGDKDAARERFAARVEGASSDEERAALQHELAALVARGVLSASEGQVIRASLSAAGAHDRSAREAPDPEAKLSRVYASADAYALVRCYDGMMCDERRERVLRYFVDEFEADLKDYPPGLDTCALGSDANPPESGEIAGPTGV